MIPAFFSQIGLARNVQKKKQKPLQSKSNFNWGKVITVRVNSKSLMACWLLFHFSSHNFWKSYLMEIIITDLTRFKNQDLVCTAGVAKDGTVIRPKPYLSSARCRELDIHPGGILIGDFTFLNAAAPHVEDAAFKNLRFKKPESRDDFKAILELTCYPTMKEGFGTEIQNRQKCIPLERAAVRSLITIKVTPRNFSVSRCKFDTSKLKAHISDAAGTELTFVGVTDRGFYDFAQKNPDDPNKVAEINHFIHSQDELYLRLGLSRTYEAPDGRIGYWIQLNGIYTFPNHLEYIRCYE